jgi:ankyrin repeat protein
MTRKQPKRRPRPGVDEYGRTPLHYAAAGGDADASQKLLAAGADPNLQDDGGWSPLHFAAQARSPRVTELLLAAGAQVDSRDTSGNTPLATAVFNSRGDGSVIHLLRAAGANPQASNHHGVSPVSLARTIANYDVAQFFADLPSDGAA